MRSRRLKSGFTPKIERALLEGCSAYEIMLALKGLHEIRQSFEPRDLRRADRRLARAR